VIWRDIEKLGRRYTYSRNLLDLSDIGYIYQKYLDTFPEKKEIVRPYLNHIGKRIIQLDPHWTNGYSILSSSYESGSIDYRVNLENASQNYIGNPNRKEAIINQIALQ
jgi:hypothetical protein